MGIGVLHQRFAAAKEVKTEIWLSLARDSARLSLCRRGGCCAGAGDAALLFKQGGLVWVFFPIFFFFKSLRSVAAVGHRC